MIENTLNFIFTCECQIERVAKAQTQAQKRAALGRNTEKGLRWAIEFCQSLGDKTMTEKEMKHALRLTTFRGESCPQFR